MPGSTALPDNGGQTTKNKQASSDQKQERWDVLNLTSTWFLTNDGTPVLVDGSLPGGASDDQWRELIDRTGVHIALDKLNAHWGQYRRAAFLNWCETHLSPAKRPRLFSSKEEALKASEISSDFDASKTESKRIEISEDT